MNYTMSTLLEIIQHLVSFISILMRYRSSLNKVATPRLPRASRDLSTRERDS